MKSNLVDKMKLNIEDNIINKKNNVNKNSSLESLREEYQQRLDEVGSLSLRKRRRSPRPENILKGSKNSLYLFCSFFFLSRTERNSMSWIT